jgi:transcriptional regulator with XRE-family HTH domain
MSSNFGARLRQHREEHELSLAAIADRTKIKSALLEALERGDLSHWPPGIYRRAYLRAYANAIGLDADTVIREFLEAFPEPVEIVEPPPPPSGLRGLVGSALGSLARIRHPPLAPQRGSGQAPRHGSGQALPHMEASRVPARIQETDDSDERIEGAEQRAETVPTLRRGSTQVKAPEKEGRQVDLVAAARVCTELGRVDTAAQVQRLLAEAATILDAKGLIVWVWDPLAALLRPLLVHGYSEQVIAQLPGVSRDDDNATSAAFRSAQTLSVSGTAHTSGALALPLLTPASCAGVLAVELSQGSEETGSVRAVATIFAAMLAQLVGGAPPAAAEPEERPTETRRIAGS